MKIYCCDTECKNKPKDICVCTVLMDITECPKIIRFKNKIAKEVYEKINEIEKTLNDRKENLWIEYLKTDIGK